MWIDEGMFEEGKISLADFSITERVYRDLGAHKAASEANIAKAEALITTGDCPQAGALLKDAQRHHSIFNFLDAARFAEAAVAWAEYELK